MPAVGLPLCKQPGRGYAGCWGQFSSPPSQPEQIYRVLGAGAGCFPAAPLPINQLP